ncbi:YihY/virulence factor BrkB family protein [Lactobacillus terrae]|uniref:YihY/virulence factor BrkB family protein n=1 Tax=Lactobacillus terrae TaxID=2269374 RepID=UPI000C1B60A3|nr:YihY/virulence factor BrkB family protein [Lactobacillus terrae]
MGENNQETPVFKQDISFKDKIIGFVKIIARALTDTNIGLSSKAITYYILLAMFPLVIIIANIIPLFHIDVPSVISYIEFIIPEDLHKYLIPTIQKVLTNSNTGVLSVGIVIAIWAISRGINISQMMMNQAYGLDISNLYVEQTFFNYVIRRFLAFLTTFVMLLFGALGVGLFTFGQLVISWITPTLGLNLNFQSYFNQWKWPFGILLIFIVIMILYFFLPNVRLRLRYVLVGTIISTTGILGLSQAFSIYLKYFGASWDSYGAIGAIIVFLLWMNMSVTIFLFGNAVNVGFAESFSNLTIEKNTGRISNYMKSREKGDN